MMAEFIDVIRNCLVENNIDLALKKIRETKDLPEIENDLPDVLAIITAHLNEDVQAENPLLFNGSEAILNALAEEFEAEGVLLQLIQDVQKATDDVAFLSLTEPLRKVLLRLPKKRSSSFEWGLNAVRIYLVALPVPDNLNLEGDEEILMDDDPTVERILLLYISLLPFYRSLLEHGNGVQKIITVKFMLQLLGRPLAFLDFECSTAPGRNIAEVLVKEIIAIIPDIFSIKCDFVYDMRQVDDLPLGILYYLVLVQGFCLENIPKVYDKVFVFQNSLHLATELFRYDNQFIVHNGLELSEFLINSIRGVSLSYELLDSPKHCEFCKSLTSILIYNQIRYYRSKALQIFQLYLFQFETRGRYLLVYNLMKVLTHTGVISYVISQYKIMAMEEYKKTEPSAYFVGQKLFTVLNLFCYLNQGEQSDLIELADQIVAVLNLLRYLAIRDKTNATEVWNYFGPLGMTFLEPLRRGLMLSRTHYEQKIKELNEESGKGDCNVSVVTACGEKVDELPTNEKLKFMYCSLTTFDVIESLLTRLNDILQAGPGSHIQLIPM